MLKKMRLESYLTYVLRRDVPIIGAALHAGISRNTFGKRSKNGDLPVEVIRQVIDHYTPEARELGVELNLTDALIEMGYVPAPTQDFRSAPTITATRTGQQTASKAKPRRDLSEYGG